MGVTVIDPVSIRAAVDISDVIEPVARALVAYSQGAANSGPVGLLALPHSGEAHLKSGYIHGGRYFVSKVATMCPHNRQLGRATSNGVMMVFDAETGEPVTLLHDLKYLTDLRTAAVGALAAIVTECTITVEREVTDEPEEIKTDAKPL